MNRLINSNIILALALYVGCNRSDSIPGTMLESIVERNHVVFEKLQHIPKIFQQQIYYSDFTKSHYYTETIIYDDQLNEIKCEIFQFDKKSGKLIAAKHAKLLAFGLQVENHHTILIRDWASYRMSKVQQPVAP